MSNAALPFRMHDQNTTTTFAGDEAARLYSLLSALGDEAIEEAGLPPDAALWAYGVLARMESTYAIDPNQPHPWPETAAATVCGKG